MAECTCFVTPESTWFRYGSAIEPGSQMEPNPLCPEHFPRGKIRIHHSPDGTLPENVVTRIGIQSTPGWYAITPNGVAHRNHCWYCTLRLVRSWMSNFAFDYDFWHNLKREVDNATN